MGSRAREWPDPPLWRTFNPDATEDAPAPASPRHSTASAPAARPPPVSLPRLPTAPHAPPRPSAMRAPPAPGAVAIARLEKPSRASYPEASLSTSSLSEAPASDRRPLSSIDPAHLTVDFDDPHTRLGVGTVGSVHYGRYFGEPVAVKRVRVPSAPRQLRDDARLRAARAARLRRFAADVRSLEPVQHPSIVRLVGVCLQPPPEPTRALLVTELMYGGSLAEGLDAARVASGRLDYASVARIAVQVCGAVRAAHQDGFACGDLKPQNVLLTERLTPDGRLPQNARACVSDMGLSMHVAEHLLTTSFGSGTVSQTRTSFYKAPEALGDAPAPSADAAKPGDVYALASVVYEMATLRSPWEGCSMGEVWKAVVMDRKRPAWPVEGDDDFHGEVPAEIRQLVEQCWAHEPKDRPTADLVFSKLVRIRNSFPDRAVAQLFPTSGEPLTGAESGPDTRSDASPVVALETPLVQSNGGSLAPSSGGGSLVHSNGSLMQSNGGSLLQSNGGSASGVDAAIVHVESGPLNGHNPADSPITDPDARRSGPISRGKVMAPEDADARLMNRNSIISPVTAPVPPLMASTDGALEESDTVRSLYNRSLGQDFQLDDSQLGLRLDLPAALTRSNETDLHNFSSEGVMPRRSGAETDDFAVATAKAAVRLDRRQSGGSGEHPDLQTSNGSGATDLSTTMSGFGIFESVGPGASSAAVAANLRGKRSGQLHAVLERAGAAFLELKRREELKSGTPPAQKRRDAKNRAEAKKARAAEEEALSKLLKLRQTARYSELLELMEEHPDMELLTKEGILAIEEASAKRAVFLEVCEEGAFDRLLGAVSRFGETNADMCQIFCRAIASFSQWKSEAVDHRIRATGILSEIVTLMSHHQSNVAVLTAGCDCFSKVARSSEPARRAVATLGGPLAVYRAMTRNLATYRSVPLAVASLGAVQSIAQKNQEAADVLVQVAGLDAVSHSAEVFADAGLEEQILSALESFSFYDGGRKALITSGGLRALAALMLRKRDAAFAERCCVFVRSVAQWRDAKCEQAMLASAISERTVMTVRAAQRAPGDAGGRLAFYAAQAVMYLASFGPNTRERLRTTGALAAIVDLLRTRGDNARVVTMATNALVELMKGNERSQREAQELGAVHLLLSAAKQYQDEPAVFGAVSLTLGFFAGMRQAKIPASDPLYPYSKYAGRGAAAKLRLGKQKAPGGAAAAAAGGAEKKKFSGWKRG